MRSIDQLKPFHPWIAYPKRRRRFAMPAHSKGASLTIVRSHSVAGSEISFLDNLQMMFDMPDQEITYRAGGHRMSDDVAERLTSSFAKIFK